MTNCRIEPLLYGNSDYTARPLVIRQSAVFTSISMAHAPSTWVQPAKPVIEKQTNTHLNFRLGGEVPDVSQDTPPGKHTLRRLDSQ